MFVLFAVGTVIALCALLWRAAVQATPVFVAFSTGWWALKHGAGVACLAVALMAGALTFLAGRSALASPNRTVRLLAIAAFLAPAAYVAYSVVLELAGTSIPSSVWRHLVAGIGAVAAAATTLVRLTELPHK